MPIEFQNPYAKVIRETGEIVQPADHNRQEIQIECLTDALGDYNFSAGPLETRISSLEVSVASLEAMSVPTLNDLNDVTAPSPSLGQVLTFTAGDIWTPQNVATDLGSLTDVDLATTPPQAGDNLNYDGADWVPSGLTVASGAPGAMDEQEVNRVTEIRFLSQTTVGQDHYAFDIGSNTVYIGGSAPPGLLSTITGLPALTSGRMSGDPGLATTYPGGLSAGDTYASLTQTTTITVDTDGSEFGNASLGNLILTINGVDVANIDLAANFVEGNRASGQVIAGYNTTGTGSAIAGGVVTFGSSTFSILSVAPPGAVTTNAFQAGAARAVIAASELRKGYNTVTIRHVESSTHTSNTLEWFRDEDPAGGGTDPSITSTDLTENTPVLKYLSGISYYDTGSTFDCDGVGARLFNNVYVNSNTPMTFAPDSGWAATVSPLVTAPSVSGLSNPPEIGETMTVTNEAFTVASGHMISGATITVSGTDPYGATDSAMTTDKGFTIMSDGPNSTDVFDDFTDERYRLPSSTNFDMPIAGMPGPPSVWTSATSLLDGSRSGELQVYDHDASPPNRLGWPDFDYSNSAAYQPQVNPDYTSLSGTADRLYRRVFRSTSGAQTNGIITLPGLADADLVSDVAIRLKVPGLTVWLDALAAYNGGTFPTGAPLVGGVDGEGCRINPGVNSPDINGSIEFSLGSIGTDASSDYQIIIEITYADPSVTKLLGSGSGLSINW